MKIEHKTLQALQWITLAIAVTALVLVAGGGPAHKYGIAGWRTALGAVRYGAYIGIAGAVLALIVAILRITQKKGVFWCALSLVFAGVAVYFPLQFMSQAKAVPPIHDITTDTRSPPQFVKLVEARGKDSNSLEYEGEVVAKLQAAAYPDIEPLVLPVPFEAGWAKAESTAKSMGWQVMRADPSDGQIEATDTTAWFGFKDDIVVRVHQIDPTHCRIDVRSVSRVGKSDVGANAARIRKYLAAVQGA